MLSLSFDAVSERIIKPEATSLTMVGQCSPQTNNASNRVGVVQQNGNLSNGDHACLWEPQFIYPLGAAGTHRSVHVCSECTKLVAVGQVRQGHAHTAALNPPPSPHVRMQAPSGGLPTCHMEAPGTLRTFYWYKYFSGRRRGSNVQPTNTQHPKRHAYPRPLLSAPRSCG